MARHLSVATVIEKNRVHSDIPFLILVEIDVTDPNDLSVDETIYLVQNDEPFIFNEKTYQPANFGFNISQQQGQQVSATLDVVDPTGFVQERMDAYAGGVSSTARIITVNSARPDEPPEMEEEFEILGSGVKDFNITFRLGVSNPLAVQFPPHTQFRSRCRWRYKGRGCAYAGPEASCSYTFEGGNGCVAKGNQLRFGGFRGLQPLNV